MSTAPPIPKPNDQKEASNLLGYRIGCAVGVLIFSVIFSMILVSMKPEAETREPEEPVVLADLITASPRDVVVSIQANGIARPTQVVTLSSEVAGRITELSQRLDAGDRVKTGQPLLSIDATDYEAAVREAEASLARMNATLTLLDTTEATTTSQLEVSKRSRDLARADFERLTRLSNEGNAVSKAVAEASERTLAQAESQVLQLEQTLKLVPSQRIETESELAAAEARLVRSRTQLERTRITAPFDGRIVTSMVEQDAYLAPGARMLELANDSELEIQVSVQASELREWIPFDEGKTTTGWFPPLKQLPVSVEWTGSEQGYEWTGTLDRVVSFDATTRMATLAIIVSGDQLMAKEGAFPLTDGMFCRVRIPGRTLEQVVALPREAVTFDNKAYLSVGGRLSTTGVKVAWATEDTVYVSEGIQEGDLVVGTRLVAPLEGVKLENAASDQ